jgi:hypothetical protein
VDLLEVNNMLKQSRDQATEMQRMKDAAEQKLQMTVDELGSLKAKNERDAELIKEYQKRLGL